MVHINAGDIVGALEAMGCSKTSEIDLIKKVTF